jgi:hypothetical protein
VLNADSSLNCLIDDSILSTDQQTTNNYNEVYGIYKLSSIKSFFINSRYSCHIGQVRHIFISSPSLILNINLKNYNDNKFISNDQKKKKQNLIN